MNFLDQYHAISSDNKIVVNAQQGSDFAKRVAGDFNPIHDPDSKRFCVPGDLLFAIALRQYGLHQKMGFRFQGLVKADTALDFPALEDHSRIEVTNERDKPVLDIESSGGVSQDEVQIKSMLLSYVAFSGHNFPHILVPLMQQHDVMINPDRPLVIYESMAFELEHLQFDEIQIELAETSLKVEGKRGTAELHFSMNANGQELGHGVKQLVLSGLRSFEQDTVQQMCDAYQASKQA